MTDDKPPYVRKEVIGDCTLYLGDCRDVLAALTSGFDALVTDPPYGIDEAAGKNKSRTNLAVAKDYGNDEWDAEPADEALEMARKVCRHQIIFGGNYYQLPPTPCWLVWDKENGDNDFADCELAWTNLPKAVRRLKFMWNGMLRAHGEPRGDHPTQKPVGVMKWAIGNLPSDSKHIMDPFMGSGTTGVACVKSGLQFTGIEREVRYFDAACRRIEEAYRQPDLLVEAKPRMEQVSLALE